MTDSYIDPAPPGTVVAHSPAATGRYVGSPSLAVLPDGSYVASHDLFGPGTTEFEKGTTVVYASRDKGRTWAEVARLAPAFWSGLFVHRGALYLMGTTAHHGQIVIRRSGDGGATWSVPHDGESGLLTEGGEFHTAPMPVVVHAGRLWRAVEDAGNGTHWGVRYSPLMLSADAGADLLRRSSWMFSRPLRHDTAWLSGRFGGWLEGNAVPNPEGGVSNLLRVDSPDGVTAALARVSDDGQRLAFDPDDDFVRLPGGATKFTVRRDPQGGLYWTLVNDPSAHPEAASASLIRNTLALASSPDLRQWSLGPVVLHHPDSARHGFQYADWLFDGPDIVAAVRTAFDYQGGKTHRSHDANLLTFHRFRDFRGRPSASGARPDLLAGAAR